MLRIWQECNQVPGKFTFWEVQYAWDIRGLFPQVSRGALTWDQKGTVCYAESPTTQY